MGELCRIVRMNISMKVLLLLCLLVSIVTSLRPTKPSKRRRKCRPGEKLTSDGKCRHIGGPTRGSATAEHYDNGLRVLQDRLEWFLGRNVIIPCYAFDLPNGGDCFLKTDRDFDGWTTTTYCEVCEISDGNKGVLGWKKCDRRYEIPTNCTLIPQPLTDEHDHPAWVFTSYDDNSLCDCGAPFIYHSRAFLPYSRTSRNDFLESRNLNDYFARPLEPEEKKCFASHRGYKHQPILYENSASPYPDPDGRKRATRWDRTESYHWYGRIKATRWFTGWSDRLSSTPLPSIPASQCLL